MDKLLDAIVESITSSYNRLSLVYSNDKFLYRGDIQEILTQKRGVHFVSGDSLSLRIHFETVFKSTSNRYCYLLKSNQTVLEDIKQISNVIAFRLKDLFIEYDVWTLLNVEIWQLSELYNNKPIVTLTKIQTQDRLNSTQRITESKTIQFKEIESITTVEDANNASYNIAQALLLSIKNNSIDSAMFDYIERVNEKFQVFLQQSYFTNIVPSSPTVTPKVVSKILPYISSSYQPESKIALIVIDGMSHWQYLCLLEQLDILDDIVVNNSSIFSWIPSITTLSRQAIFRGDRPQSDYSQSPANERKLWFDFWEGKGVSSLKISYNYDNLVDINQNVTRLAYVIGELDEKMHASSDYIDLYALTKTWVKKGIVEQIDKLTKLGFTIFLTADHGNIQTQSWRALTQIEKTGTRELGSRSQRHLEYSNSWPKEQFIANNPDIAPHLFVRENSMAISNNWNFSNKGSVSHGGSHILEVIVPFITIKKKDE